WSTTFRRGLGAVAVGFGSECAGVASSISGQEADVGSGEADHPLGQGRFLHLVASSLHAPRFLHTGRVGGFPSRPLRCLSQCRMGVSRVFHREREVEREILWLPMSRGQCCSSLRWELGCCHAAMGARVLPCSEGARLLPCSEGESG
ncbi:unnamed protein product, partial [Musa textilis]